MRVKQSIVMIMLAVFTAQFSWASEPLATLSISLGSVHVQRKENANWLNLPVGDFIFEGDRLRTGAASKAEVLFHDGSVVFIGEESEMEFMNETTNSGSKKKNSLFLFFGSMWNSVVRGSDYEVESIHALATVKGTEFKVSVDDAMTLWVAEGSVEIANEHGKVLAKKNHTASVSKHRPPAVEKVSKRSLPKPDEIDSDLEFSVHYESQLYQHQWQPVSITVQNRDSANTQEHFSGSVQISSSEGLFISLDKLSKNQSIEQRISNGRLSFYMYADTNNGKLSLSSPDIPGKSEAFRFNEAKTSEQVLIQFTDKHGQTRRIQANYKKK